MRVGTIRRRYEMDTWMVEVGDGLWVMVWWTAWWTASHSRSCIEYGRQFLFNEMSNLNTLVSNMGATPLFAKVVICGMTLTKRRNVNPQFSILTQVPSSNTRLQQQITSQIYPPLHHDRAINLHCLSSSTAASRSSR